MDVMIGVGKRLQMHEHVAERGELLHEAVFHRVADAMSFIDGMSCRDDQRLMAS
jgi:hypothetical protein